MYFTGPGLSFNVNVINESFVVTKISLSMVFYLLLFCQHHLASLPYLLLNLPLPLNLSLLLPLEVSSLSSLVLRLLLRSHALLLLFFHPRNPLLHRKLFLVLCLFHSSLLLLFLFSLPLLLFSLEPKRLLLLSFFNQLFFMLQSKRKSRYH